MEKADPSSASDGTWLLLWPASPGLGSKLSNGTTAEPAEHGPRLGIGLAKEYLYLAASANKPLDKR